MTEMKSAEEILKARIVKFPSWGAMTDKKIRHNVISAMHTHTEQALREFAERVKLSAKLNLESTEEDKVIVASQSRYENINWKSLEEILDSLLTELQNKSNP